MKAEAANDEPLDRPLHEAARNGDEGMVLMLIAKGAAVNLAEQQHGATALHYAAGGGHVDAARVLVAKGADLDARDNDGRTPLQWALDGRHNKMAEFLTDIAADGSTG